MQGVFQWTVNEEWVSLYDTPRSSNIFIGPNVCNEVMFTPSEVHLFSKQWAITIPEQSIIPIIAHLTNSSLPMPNVEVVFRRSADLVYKDSIIEVLQVIEFENSVFLYGGEVPSEVSEILGTSYCMEFTEDMASGLFKIITKTNKKDDYD